MKMRNLFLAFAILLGLQSYAQQDSLKNDIIMTTDGQILQVKVTKVTDNIISFNYPGESVTNEIQSTGVNKIVFASGRTQNFGGTVSDTAQVEKTPQPPASKTPEQQTSSTFADYMKPESTITTPTFTKNTMAIIPVKFMKDGTYDKMLSRDATDHIVTLTTQNTGTSGIQILGKEEAIQKLLTAGINYEKLRSSSPQELRKVLGTEYLLYLTVEEKEKGKEIAKKSSGYDFLSGEDEAVTTNENKMQVELSAKLKVYDAKSEVEAFEVDFFETIFKRTPAAANANMSNKWRSSLRYLTDQMYTSKIFVNP